jgi:hypothetical protein
MINIIKEKHRRSVLTFRELISYQAKRVPKIIIVTVYTCCLNTDVNFYKLLEFFLLGIIINYKRHSLK